MNVDLSTTYLGLKLKHPLAVGACSALTGDIDMLRRLEDAGASMAVLPSLFEEQIEHDERDPLPRRRLHRQRHRRHVRPGAAADFLQVVDQHVDILQHLGRRSSVLSLIERVDRNAGLRILLVEDLHACFGVATDPMLGREQRDQLQIFVPGDQVDV